MSAVSRTRESRPGAGPQNAKAVTVLAVVWAAAVGFGIPATGLEGVALAFAIAGAALLFVVVALPLATPPLLRRRLIDRHGEAVAVLRDVAASHVVANVVLLTLVVAGTRGDVGSGWVDNSLKILAGVAAVVLLGEAFLTRDSLKKRRDGGSEE
jgi:hypothetical protein